MPNLKLRRWNEEKSHFVSFRAPKRRVGMLPFQRIMESLQCPHCRTSVDARASVCAGCGAEIVRGASRNEKNIAGCLFSFAGLVLSLIVLGALAAPKLDYGKGLVAIVGLVVVVALFNMVGVGVAKLLFRSKLRFFRNYRHQ